MTQDDIIRMAQEAGVSIRGHYDETGSTPQELERFANLVAAAERNKVAQWIMARGYSTGHGDTVDDLLKELELTVREQERELCAQQKPWVKTYAGGKPNYTVPEEQPEQHEQILMDALIGGTGVMLGDKRIDPASIYKQPEQEPVAWMHKHIENNVITHRPADLDRHPDRWVALYKTPPPCPTCEALARTVMMDQTSHDMFQRQWQGLTADEIWDEWNEQTKPERSTQNFVAAFARAIEAKLREKNNG
jgi:hypothetical protein